MRAGDASSIWARSLVPWAWQGRPPTQPLKPGLAGFSRSLAQEVGARGITVNTVEPGFIATDMTEGIDEGVKVMVDTSVPAKRMGTAEEVAALVSFLASEESSYITGARLPINGGLYMD